MQRRRAVPRRELLPLWGAAQRGGRHGHPAGRPMISTVAADWIAHGRSHQWQGRPVDAMLCFRRAVREAPQAYEPRFHLGEVLWQLGRLPDAIACWRECVTIAPDQRAAQQALAEALLGTGDDGGARACATRLLQLDPADSRARAIAAVASFPSTPDESAAAIVEALGRDASIVTVASIAGPLAQLLDRPSTSHAAPVLDAIIALGLDASACRADARAAFRAGMRAARCVRRCGSARITRGSRRPRCGPGPQPTTTRCGASRASPRSMRPITLPHCALTMRDYAYFRRSLRFTSHGRDARAAIGCALSSQPTARLPRRCR